MKRSITVTDNLYWQQKHWHVEIVIYCSYSKDDALLCIQILQMWRIEFLFFKILSYISNTSLTKSLTSLLLIARKWITNLFYEVSQKLVDRINFLLFISLIHKTRFINLSIGIPIVILKRKASLYSLTNKGVLFYVFERLMTVEKWS